MLQINNAAILVRGTWDEATYNETLAVDVTGPLSLTEQLAPLMPRDSLVIMVSSGGGVVLVQAAADVDLNSTKQLQGSIFTSGCGQWL